MDEVDECFDVVHGSFRDNAVPQVEYMSGPTCCLIQDILRLLVNS